MFSSNVNFVFVFWQRWQILTNLIISDNFHIFWLYLKFLTTLTILETCDFWDTDYNSDNWEPEFMTVFVTWQSWVTLDSIRNSCDVYLYFYLYLYANDKMSCTSSNVQNLKLILKNPLLQEGFNSTRIDPIPTCSIFL